MPFPQNNLDRHFNKNSPWYFSGFSIFLILIWNIPTGFIYLYPITILATYFHEMGHGLAALLLGGNFHYLLVHPDGSGVAVHSGVHFLGSIGQALVAISGPLGPTFAGMLFIYSSGSVKATQRLLVIVGALIVITVIIWVRSVFGVIFLIAVGALLMYIGIKSSDRVKQLVLQFLGVSSMLSLYPNVGYFFIDRIEMNGEIMYSDTGYLEKYLFLPYWMWAIIILGISFFAFYKCFAYLYHKNKGFQ